MSAVYLEGIRNCTMLSKPVDSYDEVAVAAKRTTEKQAEEQLRARLKELKPSERRRRALECLVSPDALMDAEGESRK